MGKIKFIKCPRCDLNYIDSRQEYCDVCKAEMGMKSKISLIEDFEDESDSLLLCPICHTNYISPDEDMCESCRLIQEGSEPEPDVTDDDWRNYIDDEEDEEEEEAVPLDELKDIETEFGDEDDDEEEEEEESNKTTDDDEFEYVSLDDDEFDDDDDEDKKDDEDEDDDY